MLNGLNLDKLDNPRAHAYGDTFIIILTEQVIFTVKNIQPYFGRYMEDTIYGISTKKLKKGTVSTSFIIYVILSI